MIINGYNAVEYTGGDIFDYIPQNAEIIGTKKTHYINIGAGFDCETTTINNKFAFPYIWQFSLAKTVFYCFDNDKLPDFLHYLQLGIKRLYNKSKLIVWDANISYEYSFYKSLLSPMITKVFAKSRRQILTMELDNIHFRECLGVFGTSLSDVAKNYTKTQKLKGDLDYSITRIGGDNHTPLTAAEMGYIVNDVAILSELTDVALHMFYGDDTPNKLPCTQTGIVRNDVKTKLSYSDRVNLEKYNYMNYTRDKQLYLTLRKYLFSGGLTHSLHTAVQDGVTDNITCYDLTSAYPWSFSTCMFPHGRLCRATNPYDVLKHKHYILHLIIDRLCTKTEHSIISKHKVVNMSDAVLDNGRIYSAHKIELYVNEIDMDNIKKIYDIKGISILDAYYFSDSYKCPDFILNTMLDYYLKKQVLKEQGQSDTLEYRIAKAKTNSIYGMTTTKVYDKEMKFNPETLEITEQLADWDKNAKTIFNCFIGYWCTAYVRQRLVEVISKFPDDVIQYDTDSVYCRNNPDLFKFIDSVNERIASQNTKEIPSKYAKCRDLGLWDDDGHYIKFRPLGAKRYIGEYDEKTIAKKLAKKNITNPTIDDIEKCKYKITFAGAKAGDMLKEHRRLNIDIFDYVADFNITTEQSTKLCARYFDNIVDTIVTDADGRTQRVTQHGGTVLVNATFNANLSNEFNTLANRYSEFLKKENEQC